jgi:hypothetical protein
MALNLFPTTQDYPFPMPAQGYWGRSMNVTRNVILVLLVLLFLGILALPSFGEDTMPMPSTIINRALPGTRTGILTKAEGATLQIDHVSYTLSPVALVEDKHLTPLTIKDIQCHDVEYKVQYWVATEHDHSQILQLIVAFPE